MGMMMMMAVAPVVLMMAMMSVRLVGWRVAACACWVVAVSRRLELLRSVCWVVTSVEEGRSDPTLQAQHSGECSVRADDTPAVQGPREELREKLINKMFDHKLQLGSPPLFA